ncbi:hypothetical protein CAPTEDRAFT_199143 [Capitella teleta]|uniref:Uncharacterized protein n=1 Tax=Capitella teleta TaxID=283909 RepID=R7THF5_CAPTE|nr:hypothetical protein CAPTEDRAFT_199143 [Capitella teleta]|eukprot:ELT93238.1 hypothetical protein CAPTEDRAFT_199143 [Capitella teleta]
MLFGLIILFGLLRFIPAQNASHCCADIEGPSVCADACLQITMMNLVKDISQVDFSLSLKSVCRVCKSGWFSASSKFSFSFTVLLFLLIQPIYHAFLPTSPAIVAVVHTSRMFLCYYNVPNGTETTEQVRRLSHLAHVCPKHLVNLWHCVNNTFSGGSNFASIKISLFFLISITSHALKLISFNIASSLYCE